VPPSPSPAVARQATAAAAASRCQAYRTLNRTRRLHQAGPPLAVAGLSCPLGEFPLASVGQVEFIEKDLTAAELVCAPVASSGTRMVAPQLGTYVGPRVPVQ
jgi:hypothetical protein